MRIDWTYIAGFFDGEGCVTTHLNRARRGSFGTHVIISQSQERGRLLLEAIRDFMATHDIKGYVMRVNRNSSQKPCWNLVVAARPSVERMLRHLSGRVIIKKVIVEDTLRFLKAFPCTRGSVTAERNRAAMRYLNVEAIIVDRKSGMTYAALAEKYQTSPSTIQYRLKSESRRYHEEYRAKRKAEKIRLRETA